MSPATEEPRRIRTATLARLLAVLLGLLAARVFLPQHLEFRWPALNAWAQVALALALPVTLLYLAFRIPRGWLRFLGVTAGLVVAIPCLLVALIGALSAPAFSEKESPYAVLIGETSNDQGTFRLYRTDCGATCAFGLSLTREVDLPFGLKLIKPLWSKYRESEAQIKLTDSRVQVLQGDVVLWQEQP